MGLVAMLVLVPLLAGCSQVFKLGGERQAIDPPPTEIEETMLRLAEEKPVSTEGQELLTVYLRDKHNYLAPMTMQVGIADKSTAAMAEEALRWLTRLDSLAGQLPEGFTAPLPAGIRVNTITEQPDTHTLSIDLKGPLPGIVAASERMALEAIVWTMTELPGIDQVKLSVDGQQLRTLPSSGMPVYDTLTRAIGINMETAPNLSLQHSMAVTLYFAANTESDEDYFVPVTRLVERNADRPRTALEQLILGPQNSKLLRSTLPAGLAIEQLSLLADTVNVALKDAAVMQTTAAHQYDAQMMDALILTLTETTGAPLVKVVMNGSDEFQDTSGLVYDYPVLRPLVVNEAKKQ